jgi:uncharacterized protein YjiS (DUF1127 family)
MLINAISGLRPARSSGRIGLLTVLEVGRQRRALARLGPRLLADIGLSAEAAEREARKSIRDTLTRLHD